MKETGRTKTNPELEFGQKEAMRSDSATGGLGKSRKAGGRPKAAPPVRKHGTGSSKTAEVKCPMCRKEIRVTGSAGESMMIVCPNERCQTTLKIELRDDVPSNYGSRRRTTSPVEGDNGRNQGDADDTCNRRRPYSQQPPQTGSTKKTPSKRKKMEAPVRDGPSESLSNASSTAPAQKKSRRPSPETKADSSLSPLAPPQPVKRIPTKSNDAVPTCGVCCGAIFPDYIGKDKPDEVDVVFRDMLRCSTCPLVVHKACYAHPHATASSPWQCHLCTKLLCSTQGDAATVKCRICTQSQTYIIEDGKVVPTQLATMHTECTPAWQRVSAEPTKTGVQDLVHTTCAIFAAYSPGLFVGRVMDLESLAWSKAALFMRHETKKGTMCCVCDSRSQNVKQYSTGLLVQCACVRRGDNGSKKTCSKWFHPGCATRHRFYFVHGDAVRRPRIFCPEHAIDEVFCRCMQPWGTSQPTMTQCDCCKAWLHDTCLDSDEHDRMLNASQAVPFVCSKCVLKEAKPQLDVLSDDDPRTARRNMSVVAWYKLRKCAKRIRTLVSSLLEFKGSNARGKDADLDFAMWYSKTIVKHSADAKRDASYFRTTFVDITMELRRQMQPLRQDDTPGAGSSLLVTTDKQSTGCDTALDLFSRLVRMGREHHPFWEIAFALGVVQSATSRVTNLIEEFTAHGENSHNVTNRDAKARKGNNSSVCVAEWSKTSKVSDTTNLLCGHGAGTVEHTERLLQDADQLRTHCETIMARVAQVQYMARNAPARTEHLDRVNVESAQMSVAGLVSSMQPFAPTKTGILRLVPPSPSKSKRPQWSDCVDGLIPEVVEVPLYGRLMSYFAQLKSWNEHFQSITMYSSVTVSKSDFWPTLPDQLRAERCWQGMDLTRAANEASRLGQCVASLADVASQFEDMLKALSDYDQKFSRQHKNDQDLNRPALPKLPRDPKLRIRKFPIALVASLYSDIATRLGIVAEPVQSVETLQKTLDSWVSRASSTQFPETIQRSPAFAALPLHHELLRTALGAFSSVKVPPSGQEQLGFYVTSGGESIEDIAGKYRHLGTTPQTLTKLNTGAGSVPFGPNVSIALTATSASSTLLRERQEAGLPMFATVDTHRCFELLRGGILVQSSDLRSAIDTLTSESPYLCLLEPRIGSRSLPPLLPNLDQTLFPPPRGAYKERAQEHDEATPSTSEVPCLRASTMTHHACSQFMSKVTLRLTVNVSLNFCLTSSRRLISFCFIRLRSPSLLLVFACHRSGGTAARKF